jgi:predicted acetyltransferase
MRIVPITQENAHVFDVFAQDYEAEFSAITKKEPGSDGCFTLEATWKGDFKGFYAFIHDKPAGFVIVGTIDNHSDIAEFYILPCYRKKGFGKALAFEIFDRFSGPWQVRQIEGAKNATAFWRRTINAYTHGHYSEDLVTDPHWGKVNRQRFVSGTKA